MPRYLDPKIDLAFNQVHFTEIVKTYWPMLHRHLTHQRFTLAAIDDVISRGRWADWAELRRAALVDRSLLDKVERVCRVMCVDARRQCL